jgi:nucleoside-diphosphate-sugar epimerase
MRVFLTGGTGAIGGHVVPALLSRGHTVSALARTAERATVLQELGATPVTVSLFDRIGLATAFEGHDAVANLATAIPPVSRSLRSSAWRDNERIRVEGSEAVAGAATDAGVARLIQESVVMIYADRGSAWIDEDAPIDRYPLALPSIAAEYNANGFTTRGGTGVVLRFGLFYGPGAGHSEQMLALARRHIGSTIGPAGGYVSSIHLGDAAAAVVAALDAPAGTFNVVDDEPLTKREYGRTLAEAAGASVWLPGPGRAATLLGARATSLTRSLRVSNDRLRSTSPWAPRYPSAREGWIATARALRGDSGRGPDSRRG